MTRESRLVSPQSSGPGLLPVVVLGGLLGYLLSGDIVDAPAGLVVGAFCLGIAGAHLLLQWTFILGEAWSFYHDPIPDSLELGDREAVARCMAGIGSRHSVDARARSLLDAWVRTADARRVVALAGFQSAQARIPVAAGSLATFLLLAVAVATYDNPCRQWLAWAGILFLGLTVLARQSVLTRVDHYIEARLLTRLPPVLPQAGATAQDLATVLGRSVQEAFRQYVPQPEQMAAAISRAAAGAAQAIGEGVLALQKTLVANQAAMVEMWTQAATATTLSLKDCERALGAVVLDLTGGLSAGAEKLKALLNRHAEMVGEQGGTWGAQLREVLAEHSERVRVASESLAAQLQKIMQLEKDIEKVLRVQEAVDGALRGLAATDEFKQTLAALRAHVEESDKLLREVTKPRLIRIVEERGA